MLPANEVDELGVIRSQIADLVQREEELVAIIKRRGAGAYEGALFRAVVSPYSQVRTNWKAVAEKFEPSRQLIAAHTVAIPMVKLTVSAK
jgi:hypothetical protein